MQEITDTYIRQLRQQHESYKTQVAVADAKRKEIDAALLAEFGLTIDQVPAELERLQVELSATENQLQVECAQLQAQLTAAQSSIST
jgi:phage gp36-like protein